MSTQNRNQIDPGTFAVLCSKFEAVAKEMAETMLMTARNLLLAAVRDFSCSIQTGDCRIIAQEDVLPIQTVSGELALRPIAELFAGDIHPGDCFLNNSAYHGNSHVGDFSIAVPVFYRHELLFWSVNRAHQMDIGAYIPSSGSPYFKDVFEEGLQIPPIRIQRNYKDSEEILRMLKANFRYPEMFYGDFLAQAGSLRVGEKRLIEVCDKYGIELVKHFVEEYIAYGDRRAAEEIRKLPKGTWEANAVTDAFPFAPNGIHTRVKMTIDPDAALITFDASESDDQVAGGVNASEATATAGVVIAALQVLDPTIPRNHGCLEHFKAVLRKGSVQNPRWPASTSLSSTIIPDRMLNAVAVAFSRAVPEISHSQAGYRGGSGGLFMTGTDFRKNNQAYTTVPFFATSGGPASNGYDGWPNYFSAVCAGAMRLESVELHEERFPHLVQMVEYDTDSGGVGKWRGGLATRQILKPVNTRLTIYAGQDGNSQPSFGVLGGGKGRLGEPYIVDPTTGQVIRVLPNCMFGLVVEEGQALGAVACGAGGWGDPLERDPDMVRDDVRNGLVSLRSAREDYGVALDTGPELYRVDQEATRRLRQELRQKRQPV